MSKKSPAGLLKPAQATAGGFLVLILTGTLLLSMPFSSADGTFTSPLESFFTATSATTLTGLVVVDTGSHWNLFGQIVVITLIQIGGFGIMSISSLTGMLLTGKVHLRSRHSTAAEGRPLSLGGVRNTLMATLGVTAFIELFVAVLLTVRFWAGYGMSPIRAAWEGLFHAISAFNNAGFGLREESLMPYNTDGWIILPIGCSIIIGGLGYPVLAELLARGRERLRGRLRGVPVSARRLTVTARISLVGTATLIFLGFVLFAALEWRGVLSGMSLPVKMLNAFFSSVTPRTAGFNSIDYGETNPATLMVTDALMFIGGSSAGTAGGVKITTAVVLLAAMAAEFAGRDETTVGHRRLPRGVVRQAMTVGAAGVTLVTGAIGAIRLLDPQFTADQISFEAISAFSTSGLSTGITADLSAPSQLVLCLLMYVGRIGPFTLVTSLAARSVIRRYSFPIERPIIG